MVESSNAASNSRTFAMTNFVYRGWFSFAAADRLSHGYDLIRSDGWGKRFNIFFAKTLL